MKHTFTELPESYKELEEIDLDKNKKLKIWINVLAIIIMLILFIPALIIHPVSIDELGPSLILKYFVTMGIMIAYIFLHEAVHGITMKAFGASKVFFGHVNITYAYAGSEDYFDLFSYIIVALAPIVVWGIVFGLLCLLTPSTWFWVFYINFIMNCGSAAGDLYVTAHTLHLKKKLLVKDVGVHMTLFAEQ